MHAQLKYSRQFRLKNKVLNMLRNKIFKYLSAVFFVQNIHSYVWKIRHYVRRVFMFDNLKQDII